MKSLARFKAASVLLSHACLHTCAQFTKIMFHLTDSGESSAGAGRENVPVKVKSLTDSGESSAGAGRENVPVKVKSSGPETIYLHEYYPAGELVILL